MAQDDLAATATYDPILPEDPSLETADFYSDWEELSDDYYDEDPTATRRLRAMGILPIKETFHVDEPPATKRRKVSDHYVTDMTSFQGIAWRHPTDETDVVEIYAPGEGEKVSLLKNWREVFRNAKPAIGPLRSRKPSAKPLEMTLVGEGEPDLDVPPLVEDTSENEVDGADPRSAKPLCANTFHPQVVVDSPSNLPVHLKKIGPERISQNGAEHDLQSAEEEDQAPTVNGTTNGTSAEDKTKHSAVAAPRRGRKRKASVSIDEQLDQPGNTSNAETQPKLKRVAPSKSQASKPPPAPASSAAVRRSARHKK
ncbi:uncharacterized protein BJX67DRAFT_349702 [Aspergillus lucknowensis]|uniref:Uncharacterized protein n=1 Tax=Aspergillus lucknowensis TaxID=176173 RepID=A0ABR4LVF2_9EURO